MKNSFGEQGSPSPVGQEEGPDNLVEPNNIDDDESSICGEDNADDNNPQTSHRVQAALDEKKNLEKTTENRVVGRLRIYFLLFLGVTAGLVGWLTYRYTHNVEVEDFEARFASIAGSVSDSFHDAVERQLGALDALSVTITSHAMQSGEEFPTVTLPDYETRAANTRILADGVYIFWLPLVEDHQRADWEAYAGQHSTHLYASFGAEMYLRTMQDQSFGLLDEQQQQQQQQQDDPNGRFLMEQSQEIVSTLLGQNLDNSFARQLQSGSGPFQTYIPTIWNFQVGITRTMYA